MKRFVSIFFVLFMFRLSFAYAKSAHDYVNQGVKNFSEERYFRALDSFRSALKLNSNYADAYRWLGEVYFSMGEYETSLENSLKALHYSQKDSESMLLVADSYRNLSQFKKAERYYRSIIQQFPSNPDVYRHYAMLNLMRNKTEVALQQLKKAGRINPGNWKNQIAFGDYYFQMRDFKQAKRSYLKAMELNSRERMVFFKIGNYFYHRKNYSDAIQILEKGESLFENFYSGILLLGDCYFKNGNFSKAVQKYNWIYDHRLSDKSDFKSFLHYKLALGYRTLDKALALSNYIEATEENEGQELIRYSFENFVLHNYPVGESIREKLAGFHLSNARVLYEEGKMRRYFLNLKRAVYLDPFLVQPRQDLVLYDERNGDIVNAYAELKSLFKVLPSTKIRDRLEHYDWKIKKGEVRLDKPEFENFQIGLTVLSDDWDYRQTISGLITYLSDYEDRLQFHLAPSRKSGDTLTGVLEFVRAKRYNFSVVVKIEGDRIRFNLYDKIGKDYDSLVLKNDPRRLTQTVLLFFEWLDGNIPRIASLDIEDEKIWVRMGSLQKVSEKSRFVILDPKRSFQSLVLCQVKKLEGSRAEVSVVSNLNPNFQPTENLKAWLVPDNNKKDLTKLKRILLY